MLNISTNNNVSQSTNPSFQDTRLFNFITKTSVEKIIEVFEERAEILHLEEHERQRLMWRAQCHAENPKKALKSHYYSSNNL